MVIEYTLKFDLPCLHLPCFDLPCRGLIIGVSCVSVDICNLVVAYDTVVIGQVVVIHLSLLISLCYLDLFSSDFSLSCV